MISRRWGGVLVILGLVLAIVPSFVFPLEYFATNDPGERQTILDANQSEWVAASWIWILGGVVTPAGMLLIFLGYRNLPSATGLAFFALGNAFWVVYNYVRSSDPSFSFDGLWMEAVFAWLSAIGLGLIGIAILRVEFPRWVAFVHLGYAALFVFTFIVLRGAMVEIFPPQVVYLGSLAAGIGALKLNMNGRRPVPGEN